MRYLLRYLANSNFQERRIPVKMEKECPYRMLNWCTKVHTVCVQRPDRCRIFHKEIPMPSGRVDLYNKAKQSRTFCQE